MPADGNSGARLVLGLLAGIKEVMNGMGKPTVEDPDRPEWKLEEPVLTRLLHQLGDATSPVNLHYYKRITFAFNPDQLAGHGNAAGKEIGFDDNA